MFDDEDKPEQSASDAPGVVVPAESGGTPPPGAIPDAGQAAGADAEKAAMVEQAKSRVAAVKESLADKAAPTAAAPGAPKPPVKKKEEGPKPVDASAEPLVKTLRQRFAAGIGEATSFLG